MGKAVSGTKRASSKPKVFERLFRQRLDPSTGNLVDPVVDSDAVLAAIKHCNKTASRRLSHKNPANFLKDYLRSPQRNEIWPSALKKWRITARQKYREGRVFSFVPYDIDQTEPFPDIFLLSETAPDHAVETVSLPSDARALGREDEAWLIQVCVHQRIVQTHFALHSRLQVVDIFHLQNSVKATPELDAIFLMTFRKLGKTWKTLIAFEAKRDEPILADQIRAQVGYLAKQCLVRPALADVDFIVPVAGRSMTRNGKRIVAIFEMAPIRVSVGAEAWEAEKEERLRLRIRRAVPYRLQPAVVGI